MRNNAPKTIFCDLDGTLTKHPKDVGLIQDPNYELEVLPGVKELKNIDLCGLAFKSGDTETGTPVKVPGDNRETWIRLSVGPNIHNIIGKILNE